MHATANPELDRKAFLCKHALYQHASLAEDINMFCDLFEQNKIYLFMPQCLYVIDVLLI